MSASWQTEQDATAVAEATCRLISEAANQAIRQRGVFRLVLAGGNSPLTSYRLLAASDQQWGHWTLYYGDERCVAPDHPQRNSHSVARTGLTDRVAGHYPIPTEQGCALAAAEYATRIGPAMPFDMVILGMGADGHTASLFPGRAWPEANVFAVLDAPKPPPGRVTLGVSALQNCRAMLVLITGAGKADAVQRWRSGVDLPVARVCNIEQARILVDENCLTIADNLPKGSTQGIESAR